MPVSRALATLTGLKRKNSSDPTGSGCRRACVAAEPPVPGAGVLLQAEVPAVRGLGFEVQVAGGANGLAG